MFVEPVKGHATSGNESWICLLCPKIACVACYVRHTETMHPECYRMSPQRKQELDAEWAAMTGITFDTGEKT